MAKAPPIDEQLAALNKLRTDPKSDATCAALTKALSSKSHLLAGKGAELASELQHAGLLPDLHKACARFFAETDKGCVAKTALANAMESLESDEEPLFLRGVYHVQMEAAWGPPTDVAVDLRATCARALARLNTRRALPALTDLLGDAQAPARAAAAQAIGHCGRLEGALPLRLKLRVGDVEPAVIGECLAALFKLIGDETLPMVEPLLSHSNSDLHTLAATTLGESKRPAAYDMLRSRFEKEITVDARHALLLGIALTRRPESLDFLFTKIDEEPTPSAVHAVEALAIYRNDEAVVERLRSLVDARNDPSVIAAFQKRFTSRT